MVQRPPASTDSDESVGWFTELVATLGVLGALAAAAGVLVTIAVVGLTLAALVALFVWVGTALG